MLSQVGNELSASAKIVRALQSVSAPIRDLPPLFRLLAGVIGAAICAQHAVSAISQSESVFLASDARFYLGIATGDYTQVIQPFASRQLGPLVVAAMIHLLHWTVQRAYLVEGGVSFAFVVIAVYLLMLRTSAPRWLLLAVAAIPFWSELLGDLVLPDLWYSALLAAMMLLLLSEQWMLTSLMMFPLMLSRESTSLTLLCFLIACWPMLRWRHRLTAVGATVVASAVVKHLAAPAGPNLEHLPSLVYMVAKVPWNLLRNVLGVVPWSNVNTDFCAVPVWRTHVPLGKVTDIGVCGFSILGPMQVVLALMSNFGLLPLLAGYLWWHRRRLLPQTALLRFTLLYGGVSLLLAPVLGTWISRLVGYAWPLFLVALPMMFEGVTQDSWRGSRAVAALGFFGLHLSFLLVPYNWTPSQQIATDTAIWVASYLLLRCWLQDAFTPAAISPQE